MIITYRFDMDDPDDRNEQRIVSKAMDMHSVLWDFDRALRGMIDAHDEEGAGALDAAHDRLWEIMNEHGVAELRS